MIDRAQLPLALLSMRNSSNESTGWTIPWTGVPHVTSLVPLPVKVKFMFLLEPQVPSPKSSSAKSPFEGEKRARSNSPMLACSILTLTRISVIKQSSGTSISSLVLQPVPMRGLESILALQTGDVTVLKRVRKKKINEFIEIAISFSNPNK